MVWATALYGMYTYLGAWLDRLGFSTEEIEAFLTEAGLDIAETRAIPPAAGEAGKLTVAIWLAKDPRVFADAPPEAVREIA